MITRIGVIYQDKNSLGFLEGLRVRLGCEAEFVEPPTRIGRPQRLPRREAALAWRYFQKRAVDLVVRFTDADGHRWQDVRRKELDVSPEQAGDLWICGVAVNNPEDWLCLASDHLAEVLNLRPEDLVDSEHRPGRIKRAITLARRADQGQADVVAEIVQKAPREVFRRWLDDDALRAFYSDCRAAAARADCQTPNELEDV